MTQELKDRFFKELYGNYSQGQSFLEACVEWIRKNLSPDEVFNKKELQIWCEDQQEQGRLENKLPKTEC